MAGQPLFDSWQGRWWGFFS